MRSVAISPDGTRLLTGGIDGAAKLWASGPNLTVQSLPYPGVAITGDKPGTTNYTATCDDQQTVQLTAPGTITVDGRTWFFNYWLLDNVPKFASPLSVTMADDHSAIAVYSLTMQGDLNADCKVNILDLIQVRNRLNTNCSQ